MLMVPMPGKFSLSKLPGGNQGWAIPGIVLVLYGIVLVLLNFEKTTIHYTPAIPNIYLVWKSKPGALKPKGKIEQ